MYGKPFRLVFWASRQMVGSPIVLMGATARSQRVDLVTLLREPRCDLPRLLLRATLQFTSKPGDYQRELHRIGGFLPITAKSCGPKRILVRARETSSDPSNGLS